MRGFREEGRERKTSQGKKKQTDRPRGWVGPLNGARGKIVHTLNALSPNPAKLIVSWLRCATTN